MLQGAAQDTDSFDAFSDDDSQLQSSELHSKHPSAPAAHGAGGSQQPDGGGGGSGGGGDNDDTGQEDDLGCLDMLVQVRCSVTRLAAACCRL